MTETLFTPETLTTLADCGEKFARTDTDRSFALHQFMRAVGEAPTYAQWETARLQAIVGYRRTKPQANDDACNTWWSRMLKALRTYADESGFEFKVPSKPKADTAEATKKAEQRANPFADKPRAELESIIETMTGTDLETAKAKVKALDALAKLTKAEAKATEKAEADALKPRRDAVAKAVRSAPAHVLALIEAVIDMSADNATRATIDRAWATLQSIAPKAKAEPAKVRKAA